MARPLQDGLLYFPLDTDLFQDVKIKMLRTRHGCDGITVFLYLLCQIYRNGYYIGYSEDLVLIMAADLGISENEIRLIISFLLSRSLLVEVSTLAMPDTVLTSRGIQMRYQESKRSVGSKRQINVDADIWLLDDKETLGFIKVTENGSYSEKNQSYSEKNGSYSEKNGINKSKVNKRKGNNNMHSAEESPPVPPVIETPSIPPVIKLPLNDKTDHPVYQSDIDYYRGLYPAVDVLAELRKMVGWCDANPLRRKTKTGIKRFINNWLSKAQDSAKAQESKEGISDADRFKNSGW